MCADEVVKMQGVHFVRDEYEILADIEWTVRRAEHWAILGPNGCGKTTLLKLLAGYEWPTSGEVAVLGKPHGTFDLRLLRRQIGWVSSALSDRHRPGETALEVALSGIDASLGVWREFTADEIAWAGECLEATGAGDLSGRRWGVLSQGERQRTLIARALAARPALLVLDEPCAGLDLVARETFLDDVETLAEKNGAPSIVFVTHHIEEIRPFVSHALLLREGRVLARGPIGEQITAPLLGALFGRRLRLEHTGRGWAMELIPAGADTK